MGAIDSLWPGCYLRSDGKNGPGEWTVTDTVRISSGWDETRWTAAEKPCELISEKKNLLYLTNSYWRRPTVTSTTSSSFASRWSGTRRCCCSRRLITSTTTSDASTTTKWGWSHFSSLLSFLSVSNGVGKKKKHSVHRIPTTCAF